MKTNLYQAEVSLSDIKRSVSSRRYMLVFVSHGKKVGLFIFKRDWLLNEDEWGMFKSDLREKSVTK
ncbi:hypothetical protein ESZ50_02515 [Weissella muntiaci]|uniref:Uncharacterized protein n=1 Tax=Weissella muntiaci TaxID=2508881 RepID=A0A6C2CAI6_9LACO|nr:hypothetical protein [Weissella muntiaci]TYC50562.1 hypothetical protein ESZ50_02515 [Weissella muntiaci]